MPGWILGSIVRLRGSDNYHSGTTVPREAIGMVVKGGERPIVQWDVPLGFLMLRPKIEYSVSDAERHLELLTSPKYKPESEPEPSPPTKIARMPWTTWLEIADKPAKPKKISHKPCAATSLAGSCVAIPALGGSDV